MEVTRAKYNKSEPWGTPTLSSARLYVLSRPNRVEANWIVDQARVAVARRSRALRRLPALLRTRCLAGRG